MEPAPDLAAFFEKFLDYAWGPNPDVDRHLDGFARHSGLQFIGPDPDEWVEGFDRFEALIRVQIPEQHEFGGIRCETDKVVAWKEGTVGWVAWRGHLHIGESDPIDSRITGVLHEDGLHWKVVLLHLALTANNEDTLGVELTTSLDEMLLDLAHQSPLTTGLSADGSVTIMFTDIEGSTQLMETLGEVRWLELLDWHAGVISRQALAFGGTIVKGQGDGFMISYPAPGTAVACAVAIQRAVRTGWSGVPVSVRIGVHAGNAVAESGDFFGRTVVVAARIAAAAAGGQILVSDVVQSELGGAFEFGPPTSLQLKGLTGRHVIFPVEWHDAP